MAEDGVEIFVDDNAYGDPRAWSHYPGEDPHEMGLNDTVRELRIALARLTEVEAERDHWMNLAIDRGDQVAPALGGTDAVITRARKAEARLAAVLALCDAPDYVRLGLRSVDVNRIRAAAAGDRGGLGFSGLCPTCRGIGRHLGHCPSGVSTDPAPVRAGGNSAETPEPWPARGESDR